MISPVKQINGLKNSQDKLTAADMKNRIDECFQLRTLIDCHQQIITMQNVARITRFNITMITRTNPEYLNKPMSWRITMVHLFRIS